MNKGRVDAPLTRVDGLVQGDLIQLPAAQEELPCGPGVVAEQPIEQIHVSPSIDRNILPPILSDRRTRGKHRDKMADSRASLGLEWDIRACAKRSVPS